MNKKIVSMATLTTLAFASATSAASTVESKVLDVSALTEFNQIHDFVVSPQGDSFIYRLKKAFALQITTCIYKKLTQIRCSNLPAIKVVKAMLCTHKMEKVSIFFLGAAVAHKYGNYH